MADFLRPANEKVKRSLDTQYVTSCSICRLGIYQHQQRVWSRKPLGLCHQWCVDGER